MNADGEDLDRTIEVLEAALATIVAGSPDRPALLDYLGTTLQTSYQARGVSGDLDRAIELHEAALAATAVDSPDRAGRLNNLGAALQTRYGARGVSGDLDRAIELLETAVGAAADNPDRASKLNNLGAALWRRYDLRGAAGDLDRAIEVGEWALAVTGADAPERASKFRNLGAVLRRRYETRGVAGDLDRAIELQEAALAARAADDPGRSGDLNNLGGSLLTRYRARRSAGDLDRAIELLEAEVAAAADDPNRADWLSNLGNALLTRCEVGGRADDLDRAIELYEAAVVASGVDNPNRNSCLNNLANALQTRYEARGAAGDLDRAIELHEVAVMRTAADSPDRPVQLGNLGNALGGRYEAHGMVVDLDRAIELFQLSLLLLPEGSPQSVIIRRNLSKAVQLRPQSPSQQMLTGIAAAATEAAPRQPERSGFVSLTYANRAFQSGDWANSAKLYDPAFGARAVAFALKDQGETSEDHEILVEERLEWQRAYAGAGARAAYALFRDRSEGSLERAVLALENGLLQGVQEALGLVEIDLERYHQVGYSGAERFRNARRNLSRLIAANERGGTGAPSQDRLTAARLEYDLGLDEIRAKPGFGDFLQPVDMEAVRRAAAAAPLIYVGATSHGGLAVLVPDHTSPIEAIELPDLTTDVVAEIVRDFEEAREALSRGDIEGGSQWATRLDQVLRALWFHGMGEVTELAECRGIAQALLIPYGGSLAQLPWHAAWTPDSRQPNSRRYACDRVVWRYAPSAKLLGEARHWQPRRGKARETLVVRHTGADSPHLAANEAQIIRSHMGRITELAETIVTAPSVLKAWAKARYVHLTTHGRADPADPMETHLVLSDGHRLTVSDLLRARQPLAARLVTLAACEAAVTSGRQGIDEIVGFPAALLRAGVGQVLAPLWPVDDYAAFRLMNGFYAQLGAAENTDLATALARVTADMRTARGADQPSPIEVSDGSGWWRRIFKGAPAPQAAISAVGGRRGLATQAGNSKAPDHDLSHPDYWAAFAIFGLPDAVK